MIGKKVGLTKEDIVIAFKAMPRTGNLPMKPQAAYWLSRNFNSIKPIHKQIEQAQHEIIKKRGITDEKTNTITIPRTIKAGDKDIINPAIEQAQCEFDKILQQTIEVIINKIPLSGFTGNVSVNDINPIMFMIEEEREINAD